MTTSEYRPVLAVALALAVAGGLGGCGGGVASSPPPAAAVPAQFRALGTEPFWSVEARGDSLTYATPEAPGRRVAGVTRVDRPGEAVLSGTLDGAPFVLTVRSGPCSDGMSDRDHAYAVTLRVHAGERRGCAGP